MPGYEASTSTVDPHMVHELHMRAPHTPWSDPIHMVASLEEGLSENAWGEGTMSEVIALERLLRADERPGNEEKGGREGGRERRRWEGIHEKRRDESGKAVHTVEGNTVDVGRK